MCTICAPPTFATVTISVAAFRLLEQLFSLSKSSQIGKLEYKPETTLFLPFAEIRKELLLSNTHIFARET
jgi:hypothetical protein